MPRLTERLAQAERERDDLREKLKIAPQDVGMLYRQRDQLFAERDAALASVDGWKNTCASVGRDLRNALEKVDELKAGLHQQYLVAAQNLAKAEAAEKAAQFWEEAHRLSDGHHNNLRARIEALADVEEKDGYTGRAFDLRALLQPAKPETALDVLSRIENTVGKLRKLLENERKDPP